MVLNTFIPFTYIYYDMLVRWDQCHDVISDPGFINQNRKPKYNLDNTWFNKITSNVSQWVQSSKSMKGKEITYIWQSIS